MVDMNVNSLSNLDNPYIQSILNSAVSTATGSTSSSSIDPSSLTLPQDANPQLSPFAQILSTLQQLQQSNPTQYQQVTGQIATNLKNAAQTATTDGNTTQASELNQLASDFQNASQNNTLPNIQDLAQAFGGAHGHHHHHHMQASSSDQNSTTADSGSSATSSASAATPASASSTDPFSQLISAFFANSASSAQTNSLDPLSIITSSLNNANLS
jgi:hypothetical protein